MTNLSFFFSISSLERAEISPTLGYYFRIRRSKQFRHLSGGSGHSFCEQSTGAKGDTGSRHSSFEAEAKTLGYSAIKENQSLDLRKTHDVLLDCIRYFGTVVQSQTLLG